MREAQLPSQHAHLLLMLGPPITKTQGTRPPLMALCPTTITSPGPCLSNPQQDPHSRVGVHEHHGQAPDAPGQEPFQLPTQGLQVHRLLHF